MPQQHDSARKRQFNVWFTHEIMAVLAEKARKEGKTITTVVREIVHAHFGEKCPYRIEDYYNPGGWTYGRKRRGKADREAR
jgi:predicted DNA-binding protein